jgi:RNA polymerase sigma factor (sigma-70 family)
VGNAPEDLASFCHVEFPRLVGILSLYLGETAAAEDLAQETLLRAARRWGHVKEFESPTGWTYRVAINLANSYHRRRRLSRRLPAPLDPPGQEHDHAEATVDAEAMRALVASLPATQRSVVALRFFADRSIRETATILDLTEEAVKAHTKRAIATLRGALGRSRRGRRAARSSRSAGARTAPDRAVLASAVSNGRGPRHRHLRLRRCNGH